MLEVFENNWENSPHKSYGSLTLYCFSILPTSDFHLINQDYLLTMNWKVVAINFLIRSTLTFSIKVSLSHTVVIVDSNWANDHLNCHCYRFVIWYPKALSHTICHAHNFFFSFYLKKNSISITNHFPLNWSTTKKCYERFLFVSSFILNMILIGQHIFHRFGYKSCILYVPHNV